MALIADGYYAAQAKEWSFGFTSTGKPQIGILFHLPEPKVYLTWYGFFNTPENAERATGVMKLCGWDGVGEVSAADGLDRCPVNVTVKEEEYEGKSRSRIAWVNSPGVPMKSLADDKEKAAFNKAVAASLKAVKK